MHTRRARRRFAIPHGTALFVAVALAVSIHPAAASTPGAPTPEGRVVDANTGTPVVGAFVFETEERGRLLSDVRRIARVRRATTDATGRFAFAARRPSIWARLFGRAASLRYHTYHPDYGLVRGREADGRAPSIALTLRDAHLRMADARQLCRATADDLLHTTIREHVCSPARPDLHANGRPRAEGARDARGRRDGRWIFLRTDGSVRAIGHYASGGAIGEWEYLPRTTEAPTPPPSNP